MNELMEAETRQLTLEKEPFSGIDPEDGNAYYDLGVRFNREGQSQNALRCFEQAGHLNPADKDAFYNMGIVYQKLEQPAEAVDCYAHVLTLDPEDVQAFNNMGIALKSLGRLIEAVSCFRRALSIRPGHVSALNNLGTVFQAQKKFDAALTCFQEVLKIRPNDAEAHNNMGIVFKSQNRLDEAESCYQKAILLYPGNIQAYNNLGTVLVLKGNVEKGIACFKKAIHLNSDHPASHYNLANVYKGRQQLNEAIDHYAKTVELDPGHADAFLNMGNTYTELENIDAAITVYQKAATIDPEMADAHRQLGYLFSEQGKTETARKHYDRSIRIKPEPGIKVKAALLLPVICESTQSIRQSRENLRENLDLLLQKGIRIKDPLKEVGIVNFLSAYHGLNDRELQETIARFYIQTCPELTKAAPLCGFHRRGRRKISLGLISTFLYSHTIGHLFYGLIRNLPKELFHITIFRFPGKEDPMSRAIDQCGDSVVVLPKDLPLARDRISGCRLDVLFYLDLGMDPLTYFLAFSRLAPVQLKRGHPVTSGIPNMDYFLSPGLAEPPDADAHYSEHLVRLKTYGYFYPWPRKIYRRRDRRYFDLPEASHLYMCPQSLFKFHPDYDLMFGNILKEDPTGLLVLLEGRHPQWEMMLKQRFARAFPQCVDRVRLLPRMPHEDFMSLFFLADAVLDTPVFSGGKTSMDCFGLGIPVVTLPGDFMRGRLTHAQYRHMGIQDCMAHTPDDFVNIALRLAHDKPWQTEVKNKILSQNHVLFENMEAVEEVTSFIQQAVDKTRR